MTALARHVHWLVCLVLPTCLGTHDWRSEGNALVRKQSHTLAVEVNADGTHQIPSGLAQPHVESMLQEALAHDRIEQDGSSAKSHTLFTSGSRLEVFLRNPSRPLHPPSVWPSLDEFHHLEAQLKGWIRGLHADSYPIEFSDLGMDSCQYTGFAGGGPPMQKTSNASRMSIHKATTPKLPRVDFAFADICGVGDGLGHNSKRTMNQAVNGWLHGRPLRIGWFVNVTGDDFRNVFNYIVDSSTTYKWMRSYQEDEPVVYASCGLPQLDDDIGGLMDRLPMQGFGINLVSHPATAFYSALLMKGLAPELLDKLNAFRQETKLGQNEIVFGVHLRLGNGEEYEDTDVNATIAYVDDFMRAHSYIEKFIKQYMRHLSADIPYRIFVASDRRDVLIEMKRRNNRVLFRDSFHAGFGKAHKVDNSMDCIKQYQESLLDAALLGYSDVLLTPSESELSLTSKVMTMMRGGVWCDDVGTWEGKALHFFNAPKAPVHGAGIQLEEDGKLILNESRKGGMSKFLCRKFGVLANRRAYDPEFRDHGDDLLRNDRGNRWFLR